MSALGKNSLITVFGGSGFVGRHVVRALVRRGYRVRVAVRRPDLTGHLQPIGSVGQIHAVQANIRDDDSVYRALLGADGVINLVGVLSGSGRQTFKAVHEDGAERIAKCAKKIGIRQFVHLSSIGASPKSKSRYARSKAAGEADVRAAFPEAKILRASVIFGPEDSFFNRFAGIVRIAPFVPLFGGGKTRFQPVYVGDVAEAMVAALQGKAKSDAIYELGGPEVLSLRQVFEMIMAYSHRQRGFISVPFWLAKLKTFFIQFLPFAPVTLDQLRQLQVDNLVSQEAHDAGHDLAGLGITQPRAVSSIVPSYMERFRPYGQFSAVHDELEKLE